MEDRPADDLEAWDAAASTYADTPDVDWFDDFLERHLGAVGGKRILDLGCGHGWFANNLRERGAEVVAVDGSARLIEIGRQRYPDVDFRCIDLRDGIDGTYDVVVALMVLMDVPDLRPLRPHIAPGGVLIATLLHPAFFNQRTVADDHGGHRVVRGYLHEEQWWIESFGGHRHYHRPLGAYVDWLAGLGLGVVELYEPPTPVYEGRLAQIPSRVGIAARRIEPVAAP